MTADPVTRSRTIGGYSGTVLSSDAEIQGLRPLFRGALLQNDVLLDPDFNLASVSRGWVPRVAAVHRGSEFAGLVVAKERVLCGCRLGVVYADLTFGSALLGDAMERRSGFLAALTALLAFPGTRGVRLRVRPHSIELEAIRDLLSFSPLDVHSWRVKEHAVLPLPGTYGELLQRFGSTTRHNFRYYRRRFESAGHVFLDNLSQDELRAAALYLEPRCSKPSGHNLIDRVIRMTATAERSIAVGLKHRNGRWLSVIGGVCRPTAGVLLLQLNNDREFPEDSLSTVLRGYLMESLIRRGMKEFIIWAGCAPPLSRYATFIPTLAVCLDSPEPKWRLARGLVSTFGPYLPKRLQVDARWIAPFSV